MSDSDHSASRLKRRRIDRWLAVLLESLLGVHCVLLIAAGVILLDSHSLSALCSFAAGATAGLAGLAIYYLQQGGRMIAWRFILPLAGLYILMLAGIALTWSRGGSSAAMPVIEVAPRSLVDFAPNNRTGVGLTFRDVGSASVYAVTSDVSIAALPFPLPPDFPMPADSKAPESHTTLAPGARIDGFGSLSEPITMEQILAILDGRAARLYVGGSLRYRLASGQTCVRHFLFQTGGPALVASIKAFERDHHTPPPWWRGDRFNDVTKACA